MIIISWWIGREMRNSEDEFGKLASRMGGSIEVAI